MSRTPQPDVPARRGPDPARRARRGKRHVTGRVPHHVTRLAPLRAGGLALIATLGLLSFRATPVAQDVAQDAGGVAAAGAAGAGGAAGPAGATPPSLDDTRVTMDKWLQTQQIISREARDWQQGKELLQDRLQLVQTEIATLKESTAQAKTGVAEAAKKKDEALAESSRIKATGAQLLEGVASMEGEVRRLFAMLPEPIRIKLLPLSQRFPEDPATTTVSAAERYQNVLVILNEVTKANSEITVGYEVRNLADGHSAEVQAMYVGLAQAYYVSANGEAGIGRPGPDGWTWEPRNDIAGDILLAIDILQSKHSPAFVPLPVKLQ